MTHSNDNTSARKGKNLSYSEQSQIAILKQEDYSNHRIADVFDRVPQTINNEVQRGTVTQLKRQKQKGKIYDYYTKIYDADAFIEWADDKMLSDKWSLDVVTGFALKHELFDPTIVPRTTTLYNWIARGIMRTKNLDFLEKLS